jgi:hypothetical protein
MTPPLRKLATAPGVVGFCFHYAAESQWRKLPSNVSNDKGDALCREVATVFESYHSAGRSLKQAYAKFANHTILTVAAPAHEDGTPGPPHFVTYFLDSRADISEIAHASRVFLANHAAEVEAL